MYRDLLDHLRQGKGCGENRRKMTEILNKMLKNPGMEKNLYDFLRANFPNIINETGKTRVEANYELSDHDEVFDHYDPTLITFPRRLILTDLSARS
jgi:hypothetical protein